MRVSMAEMLLGNSNGRKGGVHAVSLCYEAEEEGGSRELPVKETVQQLFIGKSLAIPIFLLPLQSFRKESP